MKKQITLYSFGVILCLFLSSCEKEKEQKGKLDIDKAYCAEPNPNIYMCTEILPRKMQKHSTQHLRAVSLKSILWQPEKTIRIKFLNGSNYVQDKVKKYASNWLNYANLKFEYVDIDDNADVKIAFKWDCDYTTWSRVGTDCKNSGQYSPSMNFGWIDDTSTEREIKRVILHEFGHVLGLIHEHQHPITNIQWDKQKVYDYYEVLGWDKKSVDVNIFEKYSVSQTNFSEFDDKSIMLYAISPYLTLNGFSCQWNFELSETDKRFIGEMYPY